MTKSSLLLRGITFSGSIYRGQLADTLHQATKLLSASGAFDVHSCQEIVWQPAAPLDIGRWNSVATSTRRLRREVYRDATEYLHQRFGFQSRSMSSRVAQLLREDRSFGSEPRQGAEYTWKGTFLLDKHLRAWSDLLNSDCGFLLVFEDDALISADEQSVFQEFLPEVLGEGPEKTDYVDLCGFFDFREIFTQFDRAVLERHGDWYRIPLVTNTNCSYIISRRLAGTFMEVLMAEPGMRRLNSDWLVNVLASRVQPVSRPTVWMRFPGPVLNRSLSEERSQLAGPH